MFADRQVDRSPTGSGVQTRLALLAARASVSGTNNVVGAVRKYASVTGGVFVGRVQTVAAGTPFPSVTVTVSGKAYYTGRSTFIAEADDPHAAGFRLH